MHIADSKAIKWGIKYMHPFLFYFLLLSNPYEQPESGLEGRS